MAKRPRRALSRKAAAARRPVRKAARKAKKAKKSAPRRVRRPAAKRAAKRPAPRKSTRNVAKKTARPARKVARKPARKAVKAVAKPVARPKPKPTRKPTPKAAAAPKAPRAPRQAPRPAAPPPGLQRERRRLPDAEAFPPTPPSSLDLDRHPSAARSGQSGTREHLHEHTETSPALTGGDVDADWEQAYSSGDEAPGGDNPTPDQDIVDEIGRSLGLEYEDDEELKGADKLEERDKHRWELDPASSEDYDDRD